MMTNHPDDDIREIVQADLKAVKQLCQILSQHGTASEIKATANSDMKEINGHFNDVKKWKN